MRMLLAFLLMLKMSVSGNILPEIEWNLPEGWSVLSLEKTESPYVVVPRKDLKIIVLRLQDEADLTWSFVKSWTNSLELPLITEDELPERLIELENGLMVINLKNGVNGVYGGFLKLHGNLWVFKFSASADQLFFLKKHFEDFLESITPGKALSKYVDGIREQASQKNINSKIEYANLLLQGKGVDRDRAKAIEYLKAARESGSTKAVFELALLAQKDGRLNECFTLLQENADRKHIPSLKKISGMLIEIKQDYDNAITYLTVAANLGDPEAMYYLGNIFLQKDKFKDVEKARVWITQAADKGHPLSLHLLAGFYRSGSGVEQNFSRAEELYLQAANKNNVSSLEALGDMYLMGELGEQQAHKALAYYVKATMEGSTEALVKVAEMYLRGKGVDKNPKEGEKILVEASRRGNPGAMNRLAELYTRGIYVKTDFEKAYEWYLKSAESGDSAGMFGVSLALFAGKGVKKDPVEAVRWMKLAASKGHVTAAKMLKDTGF